MYLQREEELLSSWWREYAECSEGPKERPKSGTNSDLKLKASSSENARPAQLYEVEEERVGVPVKGGLYEVFFFLISFFLFLVSAFVNDLLFVCCMVLQVKLA